MLPGYYLITRLPSRPRGVQRELRTEHALVSLLILILILPLPLLHLYHLLHLEPVTLWDLINTGYGCAHIGRFVIWRDLRNGAQFFLLLFVCWQVVEFGLQRLHGLIGRPLGGFSES